jgi:hypothetical protein
MKKQLTGITKKVASIAIAAVLCLGLSIPAFAADWAQGTPGQDAKAAITKELKMPIGTNTPAATFTFKFTPSKYNNDASKVGEVPAIDPTEITFDGNSINSTTGQVKTVTKQSGPIDAARAKFSKTGIYEYIVTEELSVLPYVLDSKQETVIYDKNSRYRIEVWVEENTDITNGPLGLYVQYIVAHHEVLVDTVWEDRGKEDPTWSSNETDITTWSKMAFHNQYSKTNGEITDPLDPPDPEDIGDKVLRLDKVVDMLNGVEISAENKVKDFTFTVNVSVPEVGIENPADYKYYAYKYSFDGNGTLVQATTPIVFNTGENKDVTLKHGEKLVFVDLHVGATFVITEKAESAFKPSYILTLAGVAQTQVFGTVNTALSAPVTGKANVGEMIGDIGNIADFHNIPTTNPITGINVDNLPFIAMIALAMLALVGYVVVRVRKNNAYEA